MADIVARIRGHAQAPSSPTFCGWTVKDGIGAPSCSKEPERAFSMPASLFRYNSMVKKRTTPRTIDERMNALAQRVESAAAQLQLASQALRIARPGENEAGYFERCFEHDARDVKSFRASTVMHANLWPGANDHHAPHRAPADAVHELCTTLLEPRPRSQDDHANKAFCRVMHRELPHQFTDAWNVWKANASHILRDCAGARDALQERVKLAREHARTLREKSGLAVTVTRFGELEIPRDFDPWPTIHVGDRDEDRMEIVTRVIWGYAPDDRPPNLEWTFDDHENHEFYEYRGGDEDHPATLVDSEHYCGLTLCVQRVYRPPVIGESVPLEQVPESHWYRVGRTPKLRTGDAPRADREKLVVYLGVEHPQEQLAFL